jgi:hypothetical protein
VGFLHFLRPLGRSGDHEAPPGDGDLDQRESEENREQGPVPEARDNPSGDQREAEDRTFEEHARHRQHPRPYLLLRDVDRLRLHARQRETVTASAMTLTDPAITSRESKRAATPASTKREKITATV